MPSPFAITTTVPQVQSESGSLVKVPFTVASQWDGSQTGRARITADPPASAAWFTLEGEAERSFDGKGSVQQYVVQILPTAKSPAGSYSFHLDMIWVEDPEQNYVEGPRVALEVRQVEKRKIPTWVWWAAGGAALLIALVVTLVLVLAGRVVPEVAGLELEQAIIRLQEEGLRYGGRQPVDVCANELGLLTEDMVIASMPEAGQKSREDVMLVVASGRAPVPADLSGKPFDNVRTALQAAGFQVSEEEQDSDLPVQAVIDTAPVSGEQLRCGETVVVRTSSGRIEIPFVRGKTLVEALQMLTSAGFTNWGSAYEPNDEIARDLVAGTDPDARAPIDQLITVIISTGPPKIPVPGVSGLVPAQATQQLQEAGFNIIGEEQRSSDAVSAGWVIGTEPPEGSEAEQGGGLLLLVSSGPSAPPPPSFYTLTIKVEPDDIDGLREQSEVRIIKANAKVTVEVKELHNSCKCARLVGNTICKGTAYVFSGWTVNGLPQNLLKAKPVITLTMNDNKVVEAHYKPVDCGGIDYLPIREKFVP